MTTLLSSLMSSVAGYIGVGVIAFGLGGYAGYSVERGRYETLVAGDATVRADAIEAERAAEATSSTVSVKAAVAEGAAQQQIATRIVTVTKEVIVHVPVHSSCIPVGLVRVLNAAASPGVALLPGSPEQSDDACAAVSWRDFASELIADYGAGQTNAEQLTALQLWVRSQDAIKP